MSLPMASAPTAVPARLLGLGRAVAFVLVLGWIIGPPFARQILDQRHPHLRAWVMFGGIGLDAIDARFYEQRADGTRSELDRFAVLGVERPAQPTKRRIRGKHAVWSVARQICRRLGPGADVRVVARRAVRSGWRTEYDGSTNLCRTEAPRDGRGGREERSDP